MIRTIDYSIIENNDYYVFQNGSIIMMKLNKFHCKEIIILWFWRIPYSSRIFIPNGWDYNTLA